MLHFSPKMLDNAHHVEAFLLILTLKKPKRCKKNNVYKLMAFMHIHRAKDDTLNGCIQLTFEINLVPRVLSYSSLRSERERQRPCLGLVTWLQNRIISAKHVAWKVIAPYCCPLTSFRFEFVI